MNVSPGSAFFQTVQGSAAHSGAQSGGGVATRPVQEASAANSANERHGAPAADFQLDRDLRAGPPGTNLNIVV